MRSLGALGLLPLVLSLPAPQMHYGENSGPVGGVSPPIPTVTAASGSLYGDDKLLGGNAERPPASGGDSAVVPNPELVNGQDEPADLGLFLDFNSVDVPQPIRGSRGSTAPGPRTYEYEKLNPDLFAPPDGDQGDVPNAMWPMGLSHVKQGVGERSGWSRQQNQKVLPVADTMAAVDMRLAPHAYRELHWHTAGEWALMLKGSVRVAAINEDGQSFIDDVTAGDVWFFPPGVPHSIQALDEGCEFLLVFDDGEFSEDETFLASEVFMRNPKAVMAKNLQVDVSAFKDIPKKELFIFNGTPAPADIEKQNITSKAGSLSGGPGSYTYHWSKQEPFTTEGGSVKILDPTTFPVASMFSSALVTLQPGAMREIHWHSTSDEWNYFLQGSARITVFAAPSAARTFDYTAGDVGYIEAANCHYVENTGDEDVIFLEVLQAPKFTDISLSQWLALTPKQIVKDTLNLTDEVIDAQPKDKSLIKPGNHNMTSLDFTGKGKSS
ncbi:oxalate decarboxylase [Apiospora rasikravindrae]|uniref:Oxalate decarboxylase n=1 Tax=Apiospora rasikravindrae TaxID=990691 RepID=A0ABR1TYH4_9PEZI